MAVDLHMLHENLPVASQLRIQLVITEELMLQWERIWDRDVPAEVHKLWIGLYTSLPLNMRSSLQKYLGLLNGEPVATAELFLSNGMAYLGGVSTLPQYRQQGIGAALTLSALRAARQQGYRVGLLTASPMGFPIYRRIGFQERGTYSTYPWHPTYDE